MKEKINVKEIRNQNARKLEELLSNPKKVEKLAKEQYGDKWKIIWAGEKHYFNSQREKGKEK